MIKLLIGGSPCTYWSIAQNAEKRETKPEGLGWELFKNFLIAREKFKPDFFLYENNVSAAQAVKEEISKSLGVGTDPQTRFTVINSALVSAQNRKRFYITNFGDITQPNDRGILIKDILQDGYVDLSSQEKAYCLTASYNGAIPDNTLKRNQRTMCCKRVGALPRPNGEISTSQGMRIYSVDGKGVNLTANGGGAGAKTGLYDVLTQKSLYKVEDGKIEIKGKLYPIKLEDGFYDIRKLTPTECERLQTLPDGYTEGVSNTQRYKALGNGWTAEVIIHILKYALKSVPKDEKIQVLSMYDGIATGRYCLDKLGFTNIDYKAYEIDKYAIKIAQKNYPDIKQCGNAFDVRSK
ncbi:MAG: DNA cytosine methyltransferase [Candidatus Fimenecus sp.]